MIKQQALGYRGMSKDLAKDKQSDKYFNAKNIRILATDQQSSFAATNEHGNEQVFTIPIPVFNITNTSIDYTVGGTPKSLSYTTETAVIPRCNLEENYYGAAGPVETSGTQTIIGTAELRDSALIVSTDSNGFDCIWELTNLNSGSFDLELRYMNKLGLSSSNLVQIIYNYENSVIEKVYLCDGNNQIRILNLRQSIANGDTRNLIDVPDTSVDTVSTFEISQPLINDIVAGGEHTSGMIQYAYSLYILNGSQTTISPLSELVSLDKGVGNGGGEVNENVGRAVVVSIPNIDTSFTNIKIYAVKYTSYNQTPEVSIISDKEIDNFTAFTYYDDGSIQESITLEEFLFLGSDPIIPQHIATKDNRLFPINIKEETFEFDLDMRAYQHSSGGTAVIMENVFLSGGTVTGSELTVNGTFDNVDERHDAVNKNYDIYKYQSNGTTLGAEGKYIKVEFTQEALSDAVARDLKFFKDRELYRLGIKFYNRRGQETDPNWVCDFKAPSGNLAGNYNTLSVTLTAAFYTWLNDDSNFDSEDDRPVGYKIIRADRTETDKTILCQGVINPMVANYPHSGKDTSLADRKNAVNTQVSDKMPAPVRLFETVLPFVGCKDYHETAWNDLSDSSFSQLGQGKSREGVKMPSSSDWRAQTFQHNRLMQMFSPEILFNPISIDSSYELEIAGLISQTAINNWSTETKVSDGTHSVEAKFINGMNTSSPGVTIQSITSNASYLMDHSFFGATENEGDFATHQVYREFHGTFYSPAGITRFDLYGSPEVTERGADYTNFNDDANLRYCNHLKNLLIDDFDNSALVNNDTEVQILGAQTEGAKCITFMEGPDESTYDLDARLSIEEIFSQANIGSTNGLMIAEFAKNDDIFYVGGVYGGNTYEAKSISSYIGIGSYTDINTATVSIQSPGDTFVNNFAFTKLVKQDLEDRNIQYNLVSEIVSVRLETTVDLKNRDDLSLTEWDNTYQPKYEDYTKYNRVYSQQPNLVQASAAGFNSKKIQEFDTRIWASKVKTPGENVDSWTDFLINEQMDLDGKYGPINGVINFNDEIFCFQDTGVARISINPRVQVQGSDSLAVELGTGGILHDYNYITTKSGCLNKWGIVATENGFYYADILNKTIVQYSGGRIIGLSDKEGFRSEFSNALIYNDLVNDNPVAGHGISTGYNSVNNDVYFSFQMSTGSFTIAYNEASQSFVSYYDYIPAWYINKGPRMITTNPTDTQLWEHFRGNKNEFYGVQYDSTIEFLVSPQGNKDHVYNNASFKMEMTDSNGTDLPLVGLSTVRVYNDYQDSGTISLALRDNMFKKFRHWKINLPRNAGGRDRIRGPWSYIEFTFSDSNNRNLVLHDMTIHYTEH